MEESDPQNPQDERERTPPDVIAHKNMPPGKHVLAAGEEGTADEEADVEGHRLVPKTVPPKVVPS